MVNNANSKEKRYKERLGTVVCPETIYLIVKRESVNKTKTRSLKEIRFIT